MDISIIIRTRNEEKNIARSLEQVLAQNYQGSYEIIIVDSGSSDKTAQIALRFPVRFYAIKKEQFSYGYALNYGQSLATGRIIVFLSAHCFPVDAGWLANLVNPFIKDEQVGAVYGKQLPVSGVNPVEEFELGIFFPKGDLKPKAIFSNANCAIKKEILEKHPFNEELVYGEDFLWRRKLPADIRVVYAPEAQVYHSHASSLYYWAKHRQRVGIASQYLHNVEGVSDFYGLKGSWLRQVLSRIPYMFFFLRQGYFVAFFTFPVLEAIRSIFYFRGLRIGRRKYGVYQDLANYSGN
jgi:glycosyltransferase involved in cell wall biosynthesis